MTDYIVHNINYNTFLLLPQKCLFWENQKTLVLADLHFGKTGHFRKNGIGVPQSVFKEDMHRLLSLIQYFNPQNVLIIGDLFHSDANKEHDFFVRWRKDVARVNVQLVLGNHDVLDTQWYKGAGIDLFEEKFTLNNFCFIHDIVKPELSGDVYTFCGHLHPAVKITGQGKQSLRLPCFYFSEHYAVLPAFGNFTGTYIIHPRKGDAVFVIAEKKVIQIK